MKILYLSHPTPFNFDLIAGLKKLGVEIFYFNDESGWFINSLRSRFSFVRQLNKKLLNKRLIKTCRQWQPDVFFTTKGITINPETLAQIKSLGIKTVNWNLENIYHKDYYQWFLKTAAAYNLFIKMDSSRADSIKTGYLAVAIKPERYQTPDLTEDEKRKYQCDIFFAGSFDKDREELLLSIKDYDLKVFGDKKWQESPLKDFYHGGPLPLEEFIKACSCAKICINIQLKPDTCRGLNLRDFEVPATSSFLLSHYRPDMEELFVIGKEIEVFRNEQELKEKIKFYLTNDDLRKKIAAAGQERVLRNHTLERRAKELLTLINS